jgi:hypothetical protein
MKGRGKVNTLKWDGEIKGKSVEEGAMNVERTL